MAQKSTPEEEGNLKLKNFMGKTKSKLMKVLGSSNELINDFSNKVIYDLFLKIFHFDICRWKQMK